MALESIDCLIIGDEGPPGSPPARSPVYFPVFPEDFKDFGIKVGGDLQRGGEKLDMPITTTKPTTTTNRLPINTEGVLSHVAPEAVTNPPGPSYLTDSYYYLDDHTPLPGSAELSLEDIILDLPNLDRESERQELQSLGPLKATSFGKKMPLFALLDPLPTQIQPTGPPEPTEPPETSNSTASSIRVPTEAPETKGDIREPTRAPTTSRLAIRPSRGPSTSGRDFEAARRVQASRREGDREFEATSPPPPETLKLRPAFTTIRTPAPPTLKARRPTSKPSHTSRTTSRSQRVRTTTAKPQRARLISARPKFESSRLRAKSKQAGPNLPTTHTTTPATIRSYGRRTTTTTPKPRSEQREARIDSPVYRTSTKSFRAPSSLFHIRASTTTVTAPSQPDFVQSDPNIYVPVEYDEEAIPGEAGVDYPNYQEVPDTSFKCDAQEHPGLYADTDTQCQTFHICQEDGRQNSFLCPNGTVFNQQYFVCDWWYNFSCDHAHRFYSLNAYLYELPDAGKYSKK